ncbi:glycosyl transferase family 90-domain-containing protein [Roridomyces roridus]|uniref:Glycosyl transferase family 90-domain-containing protein n=1 Tax=Roridomyces roridus TaxID=1738132 RepID=A0AAD7FKA3_9AGAR|nr:glycosyl transferase family 90-domain-containing protein [Roridomyces roridus]
MAFRLLRHQYTALWARTTQRQARWGPWIALICVGGLLFLLGVSFTSSSPSHDDPYDTTKPYPFGGTPTGVPAIDQLYARQSSSLEEAAARYALRNNRPPPPGYHRWFSFARNHSCLIDEYDQIARDFAPFYQLAREKPAFFKKMVNLGLAKVKRSGNGMKTGRFSGGKFSFTDDHGTLYHEPSEWPNTFSRFAYFMPEMNVIVNGRDEPRVLFNPRQPDMRTKALEPTDKDPFEISPHPTDKFLRDDMNCLLPNQPTGFTGLANDASAFMLYSSSTQFTTDLYPILSMTKISPCWSDIMVPSQFYYSDSRWAGRFPHPNDIPWADKTPKLYWRGMTSGGWIYDSNYHAFPRFRLISIARNHTDLLDVALSAFHESLCGEHCDMQKIKAEYGVTDKSAPREELYRYRYAFDVDGNSFSGRYLGLLRSGSLVFKSTVFTEYFNDWLRPYEHYIPVLPDLSDLTEKVEWAIKHDAEAHAIQMAGQRFAEIVLSDAQNDCYWALVLLEWGRLVGGFKI